MKLLICLLILTGFHFASDFPQAGGVTSEKLKAKSENGDGKQAAEWRRAMKGDTLSVTWDVWVADRADSLNFLGDGFVAWTYLYDKNTSLYDTTSKVMVDKRFGWGAEFGLHDVITVTGKTMGVSPWGKDILRFDAVKVEKRK